jgi:hypothetical protein
MNRLIRHIRSNAISYLALFVALGGTSYAAINLPAGSVGPRQLQNRAVTTSKLANGSVTGSKLDRREVGGLVAHLAAVRADGTAYAGSRGVAASAGPGGLYRVSWGARFPSQCAVFTSSPGVAGHAPIADSIGTQIVQPAARHGATAVWVFPYSAGKTVAAPFNVAVIC